MVESQFQMTDWAENRLREARRNLTDIEINLEQAQENGWHLRGWQDQRRIAKKQVEFYEKVHAALAAGYVIIPDFPMDIFAVRTKKNYPDPNAYDSNRDWQDTNREQQSEAPALGEGQYVSNLPVVKQTKYQDGENTKNHNWSSDFKPVDFPIKLVQPIVLEKTGKALEQKIFDVVGICPPKPKGKDPMIIGRINFRQRGDVRKSVSFLIAWWMDTRDLEV
jgi:hypothetical protein